MFTENELKIIWRLIRGYEYVGNLNSEEKELKYKVKALITEKHFDKKPSPIFKRTPQGGWAGEI